MDCSPPGYSIHGILHARILEQVGALLQGIFPTRGQNPCLFSPLHLQVGSLPLIPPEKPSINFGFFSLWRRVLWGESKLAKMVCSGSLALGFVNKDQVTAESICGTAHVLHEVLTWSRTTLCMGSSLKLAILLPHHSCVHFVSQEERGCIVLCYVMSAATAAAPARKE